MALANGRDLTRIVSAELSAQGFRPAPHPLFVDLDAYRIDREKYVLFAIPQAARIYKRGPAFYLNVDMWDASLNQRIVDDRVHWADTVRDYGLEERFRGDGVGSYRLPLNAVDPKVLVEEWAVEVAQAAIADLIRWESMIVSLGEGGGRTRDLVVAWVELINMSELERAISRGEWDSQGSYGTLLLERGMRRLRRLRDTCIRLLDAGEAPAANELQRAICTFANAVPRNEWLSEVLHRNGGYVELASELSLVHIVPTGDTGRSVDVAPEFTAFPPSE